MARKTKEAAEATRLEILDAAELCFLRDGVARATLEQIAAQAGYTRGAVYWHFENKLEVLDAVFDRVALPVFARLEMVGKTADQPLQAIRQFFRDAFDQFERHPHARNVFEILRLRCEFVEDTKPLFLRNQCLQAQANENITKALQRARQLGQLRDEADPATCARAIHYLVDGALHEWISNPGTTNLRRDAMSALDALIDGLACSSTDALRGAKAHATRPARARLARARRQ
jgi:TetR/AcrR family acrAB operon transcriptional repressor